jgi:hypothetical protein
MLECGCTWSANSSAEAVLSQLLSAMHHACNRLTAAHQRFKKVSSGVRHLIVMRLQLLPACLCALLRSCPGHTFIVFLDGGFPVNCLNAVKNVTEVRN